MLQAVGDEGDDEEVGPLAGDEPFAGEGSSRTAARVRVPQGSVATSTSDSRVGSGAAATGGGSSGGGAGGERTAVGAAWARAGDWARRVSAAVDMTELRGPQYCSNATGGPAVATAAATAGIGAPATGATGAAAL